MRRSEYGLLFVIVRVDRQEEEDKQHRGEFSTE